MSIKKPEVVAWYYKHATREHLKRLMYRPMHKVGENYEEIELIRLSDYKALQAECEKLREDADRWRAISQKRELGKKYGCHCDLEEGMEPDGCVIDSGERHNCIYAKTIEVKEQCEYWRVIVTDSDVQEKSK